MALRRTPKGKIPYELMEGYPKFACSKYGWTGTEVYRLHVDYAYKLALEVLPEPQIVGGLLQNVSANTYTMPGMPLLIAKSIEFEPFDKNLPLGWNAKGEHTYTEHVLATISYESFDSAAYKHEWSVGGEFMTLPKGGVKWEGDMTPITSEDIQAGKLITITDHTFTWENIPELPSDTIKKLNGTVNKTEFLGRKPEVLLFTGASVEETAGANGKPRYRLSLKIMERGITDTIVKSGSKKSAHVPSSLTRGMNAEQALKVRERLASRLKPQDKEEEKPDYLDDIGWNHFYDPVKCKWRKVVLFNPEKPSEDERPIYRLADFAELFVPTEDTRKTDKDVPQGGGKTPAGGPTSPGKPATT